MWLKVSQDGTAKQLCDCGPKFVFHPPEACGPASLLLDDRQTGFET